ncbi:MAG: hypothetical protein CMF50_09155 [Legionellales bacterium]|nr:hypothetical protein [Legionellales bacterium]|tara:strand:- start:7095 stop:7370 length:276 start_codon:yes stop_codon:yes gene_type:complete
MNDQIRTGLITGVLMVGLSCAGIVNASSHLPNQHNINPGSAGANQRDPASNQRDNQSLRETELRDLGERQKPVEDIHSTQMPVDEDVNKSE